MYACMLTHVKTVRDTKYLKDERNPHEEEKEEELSDENGMHKGPGAGGSVAIIRVRKGLGG